METEEGNSAEFQEKTGLKRKLTGPPRLLLGKNRSPGQDEKKSRKHRRQNDDDTPTDMRKDEQSAELHELSSPDSPDTVLTSELDVGTCMDLQEEYVETSSNLEQDPKKRRRSRRKAGATIRRIFSCIRRRKELKIKAVGNVDEKMHNSTGDEELLLHSCNFLEIKCEEEQVNKISPRRLSMRMWHIFKKRSSKAKQECKEHGAGCSETEVSCVDQHISGAAVTPAVEKQQKESSGIDEDNLTRIQEEIYLEAQEPKNKVMETTSLNVEVNVDSVFVHENHQHPSESHFISPVDKEEPEIQISEAPLTALEVSDSHPEDPRMSPEDPDADVSSVDFEVENANVCKCQPVIMIEDVHSSDDENVELFENAAPRYGTLSPLLTLSGSCYALKTTTESRFSEILLVQTALSLVRAAISSAVEQLSAELQSQQMDQDHV